MRDELGRRRVLLALVGAALALGLVAALVAFLVPVLNVGRASGALRTRDAGRSERTALERQEPSPPATSAVPAPEVPRESVTEAGDGSAGPSLRLRVLDELTDAPVGGARATLFDRAEPLGRRTDERGESVLPVLDPEREWLLVVECAGYVPIRLMTHCPPTATVRLAPAFRLAARVVAADTGEPVPGAEVAFERQDCSECERESVRSAADGRFAIEGLGLERVHTLEFVAPGFAALKWSFRARAEDIGREHEIPLPRGVALSGRVVDASSGVGLSGARVGELVCDADGRFAGRILPLPGGAQAHFPVQAPRHVRLFVRAEVETLVGLEQEFRLPRPAWIEGRLGARDGTALASGEVQHMGGAPERRDGVPIESSPLYELPERWFYELDSNSVEIDASGRYRLAVLPWSLNGWLTAHGEGCDPARVFWKTTANPEGVQNFDWRLEPIASSVAGPTVLGRVQLDGEHWPLAGTVTWRGPTRGGHAALDGGQFKLAVEPGEVELEAELALLPGVRSAPVRARLGPDEWRQLVLEVRVPSLTITGRVAHADGTPVADVALGAKFAVPGEERRTTLVRRTRSDRRGEYALRVFDTGRPWTVVCEAPCADGLEREAPAGASGVDFVVPNARGVRVRVRDGRTGEVLARDVGFQLLEREEGRDFGRVEPLDEQADPGGYTEFATLAEMLDLLVLPRTEVFPALAPAWRMDCIPGAEPIELVLVPGLTLELELAAGAEPFPATHELYLVEEPLWSSVWASDWRDDSPLAELAQRRRVSFDEAGRARFANLAAGPVRFRLFPNDLQVTPASFRLDPGQPPIEVHWERQ